MHAVSPRLLIVEDDPTIAGNLFEFFESRGFSVDAAYDGRSALQRLAGSAFEAVILDIGLPGTDGLTVLHRLRNELGCERQNSRQHPVQARLHPARRR